jgi:hypothetical protein
VFRESGYPLLEFLLVLVALAGAAWVLRRATASYGVWTLANLLVPLSTPIATRVLQSAPRYLVVVFPLTWGLVHLADRFRLHTAVVAVSSGLLMLCLALFVNRYWLF